MSKQKHPEVVVVTGASAGLGRAIAHSFARRSAKIALLARGVDGLEAAKREVEELGGEALVIPTDVGEFAQVQSAAERVERELGPIDVWVNNAMLSVFSPVMEMKPEEYKRVTDVTYLGYVWGTLVALQRMKPRDRGVIVQVGSALAKRSIPLQSAYCAAKHAVEGFTESLFSELLHDKSSVRVTVVQMPALNTPQFDWVRSRLPRQPQPVPPIFQPEVGAEAVYFAAHNERRELYVGWPTVKAIEGEKVVAGYIDQYLAKTNYDAQQTDEPAPAGRKDNLWAPVAGEHRTHGRFDDRAKSFSAQFWASTHRGLLAALALVGAAAAAATVMQPRRRFAWPW